LHFLPLEVAKDLGHALNADATSLFNRERMIGRLQLDPGTLGFVAKMDARLETLCARVERQRGGEPPKERADM